MDKIELREDNELSPHEGWEIARGDELTCWAQLELAIKDHKENCQVVLDGEGWRVGRGRYVWELHTIQPQEYVPGLSMRRLNEQDAERLLRRYQLVKSIFAGKVRHHEVTKRVEYLGGPKDSYRVDVHRLLLAANKAGHTWDTLCEALGMAEKMRPELPVGFIMSAAQLLSPKDPNQFFARPNASEMARGEDDLVLRTLLPRVDTVRYRLSNVSDDLKQTVRDAITELIDCLRVRKMRQVGMFVGENELPQLVHAHDGEELRLKLQDHGLVLYACVLPHFFPMEGLPDLVPREGLAPFAFGHALYLHIEEET